LIAVLDTKSNEKETIETPYLPQGVQLTSDYLIWKKHPNKIYYYDLASKEKNSIRLRNYVGHIRAFGKTIMWMMSPSEVGVYRYKAHDQHVERLTTFSEFISDVKDVSANERYFAWDIDEGPKQQDIFVYDAKKDEVKQLGKRAVQRSPDLDGDKLVWVRGSRAKSQLSGLLTVVGAPHMIPIRRKSQIAASDEDPLMESLDAASYADNNGDAIPDLGTGRIMGLTVSDASVLVARSLFYDQLQAVSDEILYAYSPTISIART